MRISLELATSSDVPKMASIADESFRSDRHTHFKSNPRYGNYDHRETMISVLNDSLTRPANRCRVVKATDGDTGEIVGWIAWRLHGYEDGGDKLEKKARELSQPVVQPSLPSPLPSSPSPDPPIAPASLKGIARLEYITSTSMQRWMQHFMPSTSPPTKCLYIISLAVSPLHQNRGVGQTLIRNGTQQADRDRDDGVFCWVHSSETGWRAFSKAGFDVVGDLTVDLDEIAREEEQERKKKKETDDNDDDDDDDDDEYREKEYYGRYTFRYMKRLPMMTTTIATTT